MNKKNTFEIEARNWEILGVEDPLWAVLSEDTKTGGRWDIEDFLATGEDDVAKYVSILARANAPAQFANVLDFGCGVGRLSLAWSKRSRFVTGVDVSTTMVERARAVLSKTNNVRVLANKRNDLSVFGDNSFDLVASHICLQHIPTINALNYIGEFGRVCKAGGFVAFQMPSRKIKGHSFQDFRRTIVDILPFGLGTFYRKLKRTPSVRFNIYCATEELVVASAENSNLECLVREPDNSAGESLESFIYVFRKKNG
jgi:ubiquinone/menaquinone biosynthesis C-methylase UbiE